MSAKLKPYMLDAAYLASARYTYEYGRLIGRGTPKQRPRMVAPGHWEEVAEVAQHRMQASGGTWLDWQWILFGRD